MFSPVKIVRDSAMRYRHLLFPVLSLLVLSLVLPFLSGILPIVRFTKERIEVYVRSESITVIGYYVYRNPYPFPVVQGLSVPFPIDEDHPMPVDISMKRLSRGGTGVGAGRETLDLLKMDAAEAGSLGLSAQDAESMPLRYFLGTRHFELRFLPNEEVVVRLRYTQKAGVRNGTYILTTTKLWRAPLEEGIYRIYASGVRITSSNYRLGEHRKDVLGFTRTGFMPEADWNFSWD
jgi:hypothetical protein